MSLLRASIGALAGRWLSLPAPRCRVARSDEWIRLRDGVRLAAVAFRPEAQARSTLLIRSVAPIHVRHQPLLLLAQLLAEQAHAVVVAGCRGLQGSEGRFDAFRGDGDDGADLLDWLAGERWCGGPRVLQGFGYAGHAAFSTLSAARRPVEGLVVGFAARDPYAWLHSGGALALEASFDLALALAAGESEGVRRRELARALGHRPLMQADRVAARRIDWLRDWLAHPTRDAFWEERTAPLPERVPETLLIGGFHHCSLPAQLADHAALGAAAQREGVAAPRLLIGPWAATPLPRRERDRETRILRETARAIAALLERLCGEEPRGTAPVRAFVSGLGWRDQPHWPPDGMQLVLRLGGSGRDAGWLRDPAQPAAPGAATEPAVGADAYLYDPADATRCAGGASLAQPGEAPGLDGPGRGDALRFSSAAWPRALEIAGSPRLRLYVESTATHTDFCARLLRVRPDGGVHHLGSGIARVALAAGAATPVEIELSPTWQRLAPGDRLRLELSSSCFPRFDRHSNRELPPATARDEDGVVARQTLHHDAAHPSALTLHCVAI